MSDIQSGETFVDGQQFNAARANNAVNGATILPAFVSAKAAITPDPDADFVLVYQGSSSGLRKSTVRNANSAGGNVSSVQLNLPLDFTSIPGQPLHGAVVMNVAWANQANKVLASPAGGASGAVGMRAWNCQDGRVPHVAIAALSIDWTQANSFTKTLVLETTFSLDNSFDGAAIWVAITHNGFKAHFTCLSPIRWTGGVEPAPTLGTTVFCFVNIGGFVYAWIAAPNCF